MVGLYIDDLLFIVEQDQVNREIRNAKKQL